MFRHNRHACRKRITNNLFIVKTVKDSKSRSRIVLGRKILSRSRTHVELQRFDIVRLRGLLGLLVHGFQLDLWLVSIVVVLEDQGHARQSDAHENHNEDATDVVNAYSVVRFLQFSAILLLWVSVPPVILESLELSFVQHPKNSEKKSKK